MIQEQQRVKTFGLNILLLFLINALIKPFYLFGIDRTVQNDLGAESYGLFAVFFNFVFLFQIFADLGIQNFSQQWISRQRGSVKTLFARVLPAKGTMSLVFIPVIFLAGALSGYLQEYPLLFSVLAFNFLLNSWVLFLRTVVSGLGYYRTDSLFSSLDKVLMIFLVGWMLWGGEEGALTLMRFVWAQSLSYGLTLIIVGLWVIRKIGRVSPSWTGPNFRVIMRKALPYATIVFLMTIFTRVDVIMIEWLLEDGYYQSGAYVAGVRLLDAANMAGFLVAGLLLPMFSNASRSSKPPVELVRAGWFFLMAIALPLSGFCWWYAEEITTGLYTEATSMWSEIVAVLMLTFVVRSSDYVLGSLFTAYEYLRFLNVSYLIAVVLNIGLNLIMIPLFDAPGAAYTTLITQSLIAIVFIIVAHRQLLHTSLWGTLARPLGLFVSLILYGYLLQGWNTAFFLSASAFLIGAAILTFSFGLLQPLIVIVFPSKGLN